MREEWPTKTLGDLLSLEYGAALPEKARKPGPFPVFGSNGVVGSHQSSLVPGPGIVVGRKGSAGEVRWSDTDFWPIDTTYYVKPDAVVDLRWSYFLLQSLKLTDLKSASGVPGLNRNDAYERIVPLPPLPEQRKIAAILSSVDEAIEKSSAVIDQLEVVKKALMQNLLTRGLPGRHTRFKQTEIGEIPEGWNVIPLGRLGTVVRGASPRPKGDPRYYGGSIPRLMVADITRDRKYVTPRIDHLTEAGAALSRPMPRGTLVLVCSSSVGVPAILAVDACIHDGLVAITKLQPGVTTEYLFYVCQNSLERFHNAATHGGVFTNLTTEIVKDFAVAVPSATEQSDIVALLAASDDRIGSELKRHNGLLELKRALLTALLSGEVRVPLEKEVA